MNAILLISLLFATPIRLEEVRALSRDNTARRIAELNATVATEQERTSVSSVLPQVNLVASASRTLLSRSRNVLVYPDPINPEAEVIQQLRPFGAYQRNLFDTSVTLTQLFFDGGKWWNQIAQAGAAEQAAREQAIEQRFASEFEGVRRFYSLVGAQKTLDVLLANEKRSEDQFRVAKALHQAARSSMSDVVQAQINLGNDQIATVSQDSTIASAQSDLAVWIAVGGTEDLMAVEPSELRADPLPAPTLEVSLKMARENRPLLKALAQQLRAAELGVAVARAGYWPTLQGQLAYGRQGNSADPYFTDLKFDNLFTMQISLRWNLFSGFATTAQAGIALSNRAIAQLSLEQSTHDVEGNVRRNLRALESNLKAAQSAKVNLDAAQYGLKLARDRFAAGAGSTLEVRDAQLKLAQAELTLIQTRIGVEVARASLEQVIGAYLSAGS